MKRTRHTAEQIVRKLKTAEQLIAQGKTVVEVGRVIEVTQPTYHRWRQQYGGMQAEDACLRWVPRSSEESCFRDWGAHQGVQCGLGEGEEA